MNSLSEKSFFCCFLKKKLYAFESYFNYDKRGFLPIHEKYLKTLHHPTCIAEMAIE